VLAALAAGFTAGYGQVVRARNEPILPDLFLQSLLGSPEADETRPSAVQSAEKPATTLGYAWPARGQLSSHFGSRWGRHHRGIDIANSIGTPIVAAADGTVAYAAWSDGGYGYLIEIVHRDGVRTLYAHNSKLLVAAGDVVKRSQTIALMGDSGRSTGPHLHFEVQPPGAQADNPLTYLGKPS
jgi:murein DD-endopeptidase MepM/ murein hydrolase activator NlpD